MNYPVAPAPQQYPPQYPGYPAPGPQAPPAQAYPAPAPVYPPQGGYPPAPQYAPPAPAGPPLATGTLDDFYNQPSTGGGPSLKFEQIGTRYIGIVARALGAGDVQQQTDTQGRPLFFRDGRPKWVMKVPLLINDPARFPDGQAQWYVKGAARDELNRAMAEAGSSGAPEPGATLDITFVSTRASGQGMNPAKVFKVVYTPPGVAPAPEQQQYQAPPQQQPVPQQQASQYQAPPAQQFQAPPPAAPAAPQAPQQVAPPAAMAPAPQPNGLSPEQQQLLAQLTGQAAPAQ